MSRSSTSHLKWPPLCALEDGPGRRRGDLLRAETEEQFFALLNLEWIPPAGREAGVRPANL